MKITGLDNRGDGQHPFGFVYFDDGSRVTYASDIGIEIHGGPYWNQSTAKHVEMASIYLQGVYPGISFTKQTKDSPDSDD